MIDEMSLQNLVKGTIPNKEQGEKPIVVGLPNLKILKLNNLEKIQDSSVINILKSCH